MIGSAIRSNHRWRLLGDPDGEEKGHAAFGQVLGPHPAAMRLDDTLADRETEPGATTVRGVCPVKLLEDLGLPAGRESGTAIGDFDGDGPIGRRRENGDGAS